MKRIKWYYVMLMLQKGLDGVKSANDMVQGMEKAMLVLNSDGQLEEF